MLRYAPASLIALLLVPALVQLTGCAKTPEQRVESTAIVVQAPLKNQNIMRFVDTPKPAASTHTGEL